MLLRYIRKISPLFLLPPSASFLSFCSPRAPNAAGGALANARSRPERLSFLWQIPCPPARGGSKRAARHFRCRAAPPAAGRGAGLAPQRLYRAPCDRPANIRFDAVLVYGQK